MGVDSALLDAPEEVCKLFGGHGDNVKVVESGMLYPPVEGCVVNRSAGVVNAMLLGDDGEQVCVVVALEMNDGQSWYGNSCDALCIVLETMCLVHVVICKHQSRSCTCL